MEENLSLKKYNAEIEEPICLECGRSFRTLKALKRHVTVVHLKLHSFVCDGCSTKFTTDSGMRRHKLLGHCPSSRANPEYPFSCPHCPAAFKHVSSNLKHQRESHNATRKLHKCAICFARDEKQALLSHYVNHHKIKFKESHYKFESMKEFNSWMCLYEQETNSKYWQTKYKASEKLISKIFSCAHPGNSLCRARHNSGESQIEKYLCPAAIKAKISRLGDVEHITVTVIGTHLGHSNTPDKSLPAIEKTKLPDENLILNNKDLQVAFNLCTNMDDCDDTLDVWIKDLQLGNAILFSKAKGCLFEDFDELTLDDSLLIIMNTLQAKILQKCASNIIYIDWYAATDSYLATILIMDDKEEVFPCGFLISNHINTSILKVFLQHVKYKIGMQLCPNVLMTGLDSCFAEAWVQVMGTPDVIWTCPWYIREDWKKRLNDADVAYEIKEAVYQKLNKNLLYRIDQNIFEKRLSSAQTYLAEFKALNTFPNNFENNMKINFKTDPMSWSLCNSTLLTQKSKRNFGNMHKTLKSALWMGQKANNRVDKTVGAIMRLVRDKSVNLISEDSEELQNIKELISVNHEKSLEIELGFVIRAKNDGCSVLSSDETKLYEVEKVKDQCKCEVRCEECDSCLHQYVCSCVDASFGHNMCKHIHLFCRKIALNGSPKNAELPFSADDKNDAYSTEENMEISSDEIFDNLTEEDYNTTRHQDNREELVARLHKLVKSASREEFSVIQSCIGTLKVQLGDRKRKNT